MSFSNVFVEWHNSLVWFLMRQNYDCIEFFLKCPRYTLLNRLYGEWTHLCWYLFSTWVHTKFSWLWTVLLFLTWLYTRFWLYMMQKHPYCEKHSPSLQTRHMIRFAKIYDRLSLTYKYRMTTLSSTLNRIESRRFISEKLKQNSIFRWKNDILSLITAFSPMSVKILIKIFTMVKQWRNI